MIAAIRRFFEERLECPAGAAQDEQLPVLHMTAAALLLEMVRADHQADDREHEAVLEALRKTWHIPEEDLGRLVGLAARETHDATSLFQFTSLVNDHYTLEQKTGLIESLWEVAYSDGVLHQYEEHLVRKIAELIYVPHSEFIRTKLAVQERMAPAG